MHPQTAVLPINLSRGYERLVEQGQGEVEMSRTGLSNVAIRAASIGADLASLADGRYIFPAFLPAPDCFMTLASALEVFNEIPLSGVRRKFGDTFDHVHREQIECPWSAKGRVMRGLAEKFGGDPDAILAEGVLLNLEGGWVLMLPDPDSPMFYVYAESPDGEGNPAQLMEEYVDLVKSLIDEQALLSS
jgi:mannose-1-phosphate guanylyltransferase/phosphomannomutase